VKAVIFHCHLYKKLVLFFHERWNPNAKKTNCTWTFLFVRQRKQRVYPYPRRGDSFDLSQNNEILLDRHHAPPRLLPSDQFLPPSLPPKEQWRISRIMEKVLICIFWQRYSMFSSVSWANRAEFSKLNEPIIFPVFSLQEEYSTYHHLLPCCAVLEEQGDTDGQTCTWAVHLHKHRWYSVMFPQN
jgi:hypothetical protein